MNIDELILTTQVNIFGFNLGHKGFKVHINQSMAIARGTVTKLKRFKKLKPLTKRYLYKTLVRSALEYPNTPSCVMSKTNKDKLQKFQKGVIKGFIHSTSEDEIDLIEDLHELYRVEPMNKRMYRRAVTN